MRTLLRDGNMIEARLGYNSKAARAMYDAYRDEPGVQQESFNQFSQRLKKIDLFWGIYDPAPVGAVIYEGPFIHAAVLPKARGKWAQAFIHCLRYLLDRVPLVVSKVHPDHYLMKRLLPAFGFMKAPKNDYDGYEIYVRWNK